MNNLSVDSTPVGVYFVFRGLPKISLNKWYAGEHWSIRKKMKDTYKLLIKNVTKYQETKPCECHYVFEFKSKPLDCSNCISMAKMIEDIIFPQDNTSIVHSIRITSRKGAEDIVTLYINWL